MSDTNESGTGPVDPGQGETYTPPAPDPEMDGGQGDTTESDFDKSEAGLEDETADDAEQAEPAEQVDNSDGRNHGAGGNQPLA